MFFLLAPPVLHQAKPPVTSFPEAVDQLMDAYDLQGHLEGVEAPKVFPRDKPRLDWLFAAAGSLTPAIPFPKGHPARAEAEALKALTAGSALPDRLPSLREAGSQVLFWRWGVHMVRKGALDAAGRRRWEDRMLMPGVHGVLRGMALRHALCFAVAENDEARFSDLKDRLGEEAKEVFLGFQSALALNGAVAPEVRLWSLPDFAPATVSLARPGIRRVWISQMLPGAAYPLDAQTLWIIPTENATSPTDMDLLDQGTRDEVLAWIPRLPKAEDRIWLSPARMPLAGFGLMHFPVVLELGAQGRIDRVLMGDAALAAGHSATNGPKPLQ